MLKKVYNSEDFAGAKIGEIIEVGYCEVEEEDLHSSTKFNYNKTVKLLVLEDDHDGEPLSGLKFKIVS